MIAGTYSLTPLQQIIRLLNTALLPDGAAHVVFAPTSHPVPVLRSGRTSALPESRSLRSLKLPKTFRLADGSESRTVFLIREHACGLDGLRAGAVPGFTNAFLDGAGIWGLKGVHPVSKSPWLPLRRSYTGHRLVLHASLSIRRACLVDVCIGFIGFTG